MVSGAYIGGHTDAPYTSTTIKLQTMHMQTKQYYFKALKKVKMKFACTKCADRLL